MPLAMGKVLGGGSSINLMVWCHGHKNDWDFFANEVADAPWTYESVLDIYLGIGGITARYLHLPCSHSLAVVSLMLA